MICSENDEHVFGSDSRNRGSEGTEATVLVIELVLA